MIGWFIWSFLMMGNGCVFRGGRQIPLPPRYLERPERPIKKKKKKK